MKRPALLAIFITTVASATVAASSIAFTVRRNFDVSSAPRTVSVSKDSAGFGDETAYYGIPAAFVYMMDLSIEGQGPFPLLFDTGSSVRSPCHKPRSLA